jgi:hypothetical protein
MNNEFNEFFKPILKKVNKLVIKKATKYPMLDIDKIRTFLLSWTKNYYKQQKNKDLKVAFYKALVTFETTCNMAKEKSKEKKNEDL